MENSVLPFVAADENELAIAQFLVDGGGVSVENVRAFEDEVMAQCEQVKIETSHLLHGGMYCRTIFVPAGVVVTGALLNFPNFAVVNGHCVVSTDDGRLVEMKGFHVLTSNGKTKRMGWAKADTYFTTFHQTNAQTLEEAEREMSAEYDKIHVKLGNQITSEV